MKTSIKLSALFLLFSTGVFAANTSKIIENGKVDITEQISFEGSKNVSLNITAANAEQSVSTVRIYDQQKNLLLTDRITPRNNAKSYNLGSLDNGTYMLKISSNNQELTKKVVVYEDNNQKGFFIVQ